MKTRKRKLVYATLLLLAIIFALNTALAQESAVTAPLAVTAPTAVTAQSVAKIAISEWQELAKGFEPRNYLEGDDPATELCQDFAVIGTTPQLVEGLNINFEDPREELFDGEGTEGITKVSFPANVGDTTGQVEVALRPTDDSAAPWEAGRVRFEVMDSNNNSSILPSIFDSPYIGWIFVIFSLVLLASFFRANFFRNWLYLGWQAILEHKRLVIVTSVLIYGFFALGLMTGLALPQACIDMSIEIVGESLNTIGIVEHLQNGDVLKTAAVTASWNFSMGAFSTTFIPALIFGIPAYLVNMARMFILGIPFAGVFEPQLILHLPTLIIEIMAYILVTAGGGMLLVTLVKKGFKALPEAVRKLWLMLPVALVLLVIGAWYESFSLIALRPLLFGP